MNFIRQRFDDATGFGSHGSELVHTAQEFGRLSAERAGDLQDSRERRIALAVLDRADVVRREVGPFGEPLEGKGEGATSPPNGFSELVQRHEVQVRGSMPADERPMVVVGNTIRLC